MIKLKIFIMLAVITVLSACDNQRKPDSVFIGKDGTEYVVLKRQKMLFNGDKMFVVTYISKDPNDEKIRNKEFEDLYAIIANNIAPNRDYDFIALEAVTQANKKFGISKTSGYRDRKPFSEVMKLRTVKSP